MKTENIKHGTKHQIIIQFLLPLLLICPLKNTLAATTVVALNQQSGQPPVSTKKIPGKQVNKKPAISFDNVNTFQLLLRSGEITIFDIPDPHWEKNGCIACHKTTGNKANARNLRHTLVDQTCNNCHSAKYDHRYIHPSNVQPDKKMLARMDPKMKASLAKKHNIIDCTTCHDLTLQCLFTEKKQKLINPKFFRSGPHESRSQLCLLCHDKNRYEQLNPHDQISKRGRLKSEKCYTCHADSIDKLKQVDNIEQLEFHAKESLSTMCLGCHPWKPHPGGQISSSKKRKSPSHLAKPSDKIKNRMDEMAKTGLINFPLEPETGKVFCGTCHNPHEHGIIKDPAKARGAGKKKRLRAQDICPYCHLK